MADSDSKLGRLRSGLERLKKLPIIGQTLAGIGKTQLRDKLEEITKDPAAERRWAQRGFVPQRCGLCANFSHDIGQRMLGRNANFTTATSVLRPHEMSEGPDATPRAIGDAARELRPTLTEEWRDYGYCAKWDRVLWGFEEQPRFALEHDPDSTGAVPLGPPCTDWE